MNRRTFLGVAAAAGGAAGFRLPAVKPLKILILGGTNLTGPHNVRYAIERGHSVTIFTRGKTKPGLFQDAFENVEQLVGDREDNLEALKGREWDAVIDASGKKDAWTLATAKLLEPSVGRYLYISSTGVYYPYLKPGVTEETEVAVEDPSEGKNGSAVYGVMKARSENHARAVFTEERTIVVRPGYIVGPLDATHRGTYWPSRIRRGGDVLVPGKKTDAVQQIDVRDLTEFMIRALENSLSGTFNVTGPGSTLTMEEFVYGVKGAFSSEVRWTWADDYAFLDENRFSYAIPWILPTDDHLGSQRIDVSRAKAAGLTFRPIAQTAVDTLAWYDTLSPELQSRPRMAMSPEREVELLAKWRAR